MKITKQDRVAQRWIPKDSTEISNSWGWEQTNVDWYVVTRKTTNYVWLQPIASEMTESEGCSPMAGHTIPTQPIVPLVNEKEEMHKSTGTSVSFKYGSGSKWDGKPEYASWYA